MPLPLVKTFTVGFCANKAIEKKQVNKIVQAKNNRPLNCIIPVFF